MASSRSSKWVWERRDGLSQIMVGRVNAAGTVVLPTRPFFDALDMAVPDLVNQLVLANIQLALTHRFRYIRVMEGITSHGLSRGVKSWVTVRCTKQAAEFKIMLRGKDYAYG